MNKLWNKIAAVTLSITVLGAVIVAGTQTTSGFNRMKANAYTAILNANNSPSLSSGEGTMVDDRGVTWEYYNASDYASGHITLNSDSYFGISSSTSYGYTGIDGIRASFSSGELWLLMSVDGINWHEGEKLASNMESHVADSWRYVRFYSYQNTININSVSFDYSCSGISSTEDVDAAKVDNVISTSENLEYEKTTSDLSPNSINGEAISFNKVGTGSTEITLSLGKNYVIGENAYRKIEFDMKTSNINYGKTVQLLGENNYKSSTITSSKHSAYHCTSLGNDWYHIEVPITCFVSLISGYDQQDIPTKNIANKTFNSIKINAGTCVIDNLRVGGTPTELGLYNNGASLSVGSVYWLKVAWTGELHSCTMTFEPSGIARQIPLTDPNLKNGSPFYVEGLSSGDVLVTATLVVGYNRQSLTIQKTLTVN